MASDNIEIVASVEDEKIASEIVEKVRREGVVSWQELVGVFRGKGISLYRLRKILLNLVNSGAILELQCRLFTTREFVENTEMSVLVKRIVEKVSSLRLRKCGKPVGVPYKKISVSVSRDGKISVSAQ